MEHNLGIDLRKFSRQFINYFYILYLVSIYLLSLLFINFIYNLLLIFNYYIGNIICWYNLQNDEPEMALSF